MLVRKAALTVAIAVGLMLGQVVANGEAEARASGAGSRQRAAGKASGKKVRKAARATSARRPSQPSKKGKRGRRGRFVGHRVAPSQLRAEPLPRPSGRVLVHSAMRGETVEGSIYKEDGAFDQATLARLDHIFRCRRTGEERAIDPRLYEILSILHDHFGRQVVITSGFRYQRNEGSRHFHGSAIDVSVPGVSYRQLYEYVTSLDAGGMGIGKYPRSNFVHIDFRAPGEDSYRWTDTSRSRRRDPGKLPSRMWRPAKPNS